MDATTPPSRIEVTCDMSGVPSRAGTVLLSGLSAAIGLTDDHVKGLEITASAS